ncbi:MAG: PadR family transcriptional regulator [Saprospiraceae bacterium]|nr:PadR family transcriptional regulator [Saprospiraceae bacterium]
MKGTHLGEFEELVLLAVGVLNGAGYGVRIYDEIREQTGRTCSISTIHSTLNRLEEKGFISSHRGGATDKRGGRSKRIYTINGAGEKALAKVREQREKLWQLMPKHTLGYG